MSLKSNSGVTLMELVLTLAILAILAGALSYFVGSNFDATRYENTRAKMDTIREAVLGNNALDNEGHRIHFGYVGDMGGLPATLANLTTVGAQAAWAVDGTTGVGTGWRGP